jgi:hypothetical protein
MSHPAEVAGMLVGVGAGLGSGAARSALLDDEVAGGVLGVVAAGTVLCAVVAVEVLVCG